METRSDSHSEEEKVNHYPSVEEVLSLKAVLEIMPRIIRDFKAAERQSSLLWSPDFWWNEVEMETVVFSLKPLCK